jgi:aminoglycoside 3-N-acetyltransferase I
MRNKQVSVKFVHRTESDVSLLQSADAMFGEAFDDEEQYSGRKPSSSYLQGLLATPGFIALAAVDGQEGVGAKKRSLSLRYCS